MRTIDSIGSAARRCVPRASPRHRAGFVLLEVLVALLIFAFGVLGIVGLQAAMTKAQTGAKLRGDAALLAQELIGNMWGDLPGLPNYTTSACESHGRCNDVHTKIAAVLPAGELEIEQREPGLVEITIRWTPPSEDPRLYRTAVAVRT